MDDVRYGVKLPKKKSKIKKRKILKVWSSQNKNKRKKVKLNGRRKKEKC